MRTRSIGTATIDRVVEHEGFVFKPGLLFHDLGAEVILRHRKFLGPDLVDFASNGLIVSFHSYVIRTRHRVILVDTCNGNHKHRPGLAWQHELAGPDYLDNLAALGLRPADIDVVVCTHLHGDHVGWNTHLVGDRWVPTFPNAKYLMARPDYDHFAGLPHHAALADSIAPIVDAGQAELVDIAEAGRYDLDDNIWLEAAPGHTPGHVVIHVAGPDGRVVMTGDVIHHPIQFLEPDLVNPGDANPATARRTRDAILAAACAERSLLLTGHFPSPTAGFVVAAGDGFRFEFVEG